jgi:hypothetical protein
MKFVLFILVFFYEHIVNIQHGGKGAADKTTAHCWGIYK